MSSRYTTWFVPTRSVGSERPNISLHRARPTEVKQLKKCQTTVVSNMVCSRDASTPCFSGQPVRQVAQSLVTDPTGGRSAKFERRSPARKL